MSDDLADVIDRADADGVHMDVSVEEDGSLWLGDLERVGGSPGSGRRALDRLCELADENDAAVALAVHEEAAPVIRMYEEAGFERIDDPARSRDAHAVMRREPGA